MHKPRIAFIGAGNMAGSLIHGLVKQAYPTDSLSACDPDQARLGALAQQCGIHTGTAADIVSTAEVVVLAVKPQVMPSVCTELAPQLQQGSLIISIAAGIPLLKLQGWLGENQAIVRCMPNTPALVLTGATGLFANTVTTLAQKLVAEQVLAAVGKTCWLRHEGEIDAVTALSGSGPAYFFLLMEAMETTARELGLEPQVARELTLQTALGAARLAASSEVSAAELRRQVTSPGGTTEQAIHTFDAGGFSALVQKAMHAAFQRSIDLAKS
ncbi:MAG: pyrroline-5-carboxylate reductase [Pseudomonadales bacterium]|nr:pyrroline-5-carboxylate reductase [Pseudomonadales bacterium]